MSEDSELAKAFAEYRAARKAKKGNNVESSLAMLTRNSIRYEVLNRDNYHTLVDERFDFWPSTGKWRERGNGRTGRGVRLLARIVRETKGDE